MDIILFDGPEWEQLLPITYTRPVSHIRLGYLSILEKWQKIIGSEVYIHSHHSIQSKYPVKHNSKGLFINSSILPSLELWEELSALGDKESLVFNNKLIGFHSETVIDIEKLPDLIKVPTSAPIIQCSRPWDLFLSLEAGIDLDYQLLSSESTKEFEVHATEFIGDKIFIAPGAKITGAIINSSAGPVIIGKNAEIMEGAVIRGPFSLGDHSVLKMSAKIYGASSIGPHCKIGGEVSNSLFQGYSNKGHDGFVGNSVIGEWCNFGADTNVSNLKNNYSEVKVWDYQTEQFIDSKQQFCGLIMGDHSKTGINTMLNTGTVVGVSANIFGAGFPAKFVPSFSWSTNDSFEAYNFEKAIDTARKVMQRRNVELTEEDTDILSEIRKKEGHFFR